MINEHGYPALALFVFSPRLSFFALDVYLTRRTIDLTTTVTLHYIKVFPRLIITIIGLFAALKVDIVKAIYEAALVVDRKSVV